MGICATKTSNETDLDTLNYDEEKRYLYLICVVFNCARSKSTIKQYTKFKQQMEHQHIKLITVECAYENSPFTVTVPFYEPYNIQVRTYGAFFQKEKLINIAIQKLPIDAKYVLWCDYDIEFMNESWINDAIQSLHHHKIIQLFDSAIFLGPNGEEAKQVPGFAVANEPSKKNEEGEGEQQPQEGKENNGEGLSKEDFQESTEAVGFGWGLTIEAARQFGGWLDFSPTGNSMTLMGYALYHRIDEYVPKDNMPEQFRDACKNYQEIMMRTFNKQVGYISGTIQVKYSHSRRDKIAYENWDIYKRCDFDPRNDLVDDENGCYKIHSNKPELTAEVSEMFYSLNGENIE